MANTEPSKPIRVFVSYSHDSWQHVDRVLDLCNNLRNDGIDAELDQYEPAPPEGWPRWMMRQIEKADFVLLVCTETYLRRFEGKEKPDRGRGVSWEGAIITQELYRAAGGNARFIPVIFSAGDETNIPLIVDGVTRYRLDTQEGYEALYQRLTRQPVPRPVLGEVRSLPARQRESVFPEPPSLPETRPLALPGEEETSRVDPSPPRRERRSVAFALLALGILISIALAGALTLSPPPKPVEPKRQKYAMTPPLARVNSVTRSLDSSELIIVGKRAPQEDFKMFRYSLEGKFISEIPDSVSRPASAQRDGDRIVAKDEDVFVWFDKDYERLNYEDFLTQSPNGSTLTSANQWLLVEDNLFVLGDVVLQEEEHSLLGSGLGQPESSWERGVFHVPTDSPGNFRLIELLSTDRSFSGIYLIGYPHFARTGDKAFFLNVEGPNKEGPQLTCLYRQKWRCASLPIRPYGFDLTPDFSGLRIPEAYSLFEKSTLIAGLYGWQNSLYVLTKCPTPEEGPEETRWFLTRLDPSSGLSLYTLSLPVTAPHVILVPGDDAWVIVEKERFEAGANPREGKQEASSMLLVPSEEIATVESPLVVDDTLPLCTWPARWVEESLQWQFTLSPGR